MGEEREKERERECVCVCDDTAVMRQALRDQQDTCAWPTASHLLPLRNARPISRIKTGTRSTVYGRDNKASAQKTMSSSEGVVPFSWRYSGQHVQRSALPAYVAPNHLQAMSVLPVPCVQTFFGLPDVFWFTKIENHLQAKQSHAYGLVVGDHTNMSDGEELPSDLPPPPPSFDDLGSSSDGDGDEGDFEEKHHPPAQEQEQVEPAAVPVPVPPVAAVVPTAAQSAPATATVTPAAITPVDQNKLQVGPLPQPARAAAWCFLSAKGSCGECSNVGGRG